MCQTENGAGNSAVPAQLRVQPASFGWRWRECHPSRLLVRKALARDALASATHIEVGSIGTTIN